MLPSVLTERLIDARLGLITRLVREPTRPGVPRCYGAYTAQVASTARFASWMADPCGYGAALDDDEQARRAAVGEAVERYCGNVAPGGLLRATFTELAAAGREVIDPEMVALHSVRQYAQPGFPFVPFTRDLEVEWVPGRDLSTGRETLVPATLVYLNYRPLGAPVTNLQIYAGIATGESAEQAERRALEELFERDALTIWWLSGAPGTEIENSDPAVAPWSADPGGAHLRGTLLHLRSSFGVPVICAFLEDPGRALVACGAACRASPLQAIRKAVVEAIDGLLVAAELLDPDAVMWRAVRTGAPYTHPYRPYRPDRAYRQDFRADYRDVCDLATHTQLYLDPATQGELLQRLRSPAERVQLAAIPPILTQPVRSTYLAALHAHGLRAISVDLTTPDVRSAGLHVARVVVPGLYCYAPAAFPLLGGQRLYEEPVRLGWRAGPLAEDDLVLHPLPYS